MLVEVKVPPLAESIADATVMEWRKQPGEAVKRGENLVDLETDKVTLEVTAPQDGVVQSLKKQNGDTVLSDELLAVIDTEAKATVAASPATETAAQVASAAASGSAPVAEPAKLSPAARKLASDKAIDTAAIPASGKDGRVTKSDVVAYLSQQPDPQATAQSEAAAAPVAPPSPLPVGDRPEQRVPMTRLRKRAAERLLSAQHEHGHPHHLQRRQHAAVDGAAHALPRQLREGSRHQARLHVVLRQGQRSRRCSDFPVVNA